MDTRVWRGIAATAALFSIGDANAQWRCDCTQIVASCQATAVPRESFVEVTSDVAQCARVDYLIDGLPFVALVVGGTERQDWITQNASPEIIVQSCQVCVDNTLANAPAGSSLSSSLTSLTRENDGMPVRLITMAPEYPASAVAAGIEGYVDVRFMVSTNGSVYAPEVVAAEPAGIFDAAAIAAVQRWRYTQPAAPEPVTLTERVSFDLSDGIMELARTSRPRNEPVAASRPDANACLREEARYDFGSAIDISLINACATPLLVYTCTTGTRDYRDRWICRDPEQLATVLSVASGAVRSGGVSDTATLAPAGRLEISRAPNSEYWWLACAVGDAGCRDEGSQWVRAMDRQTTSLDPQDRSRMRLARSY